MKDLASSRAACLSGGWLWAVERHWIVELLLVNLRKSHVIEIIPQSRCPIGRDWRLGTATLAESDGADSENERGQG